MNVRAREVGPVENDTVDNAGQNILALFHRASALAEQNTRHALDAAHRVAVQLRASEDRIAELESAVRFQQARADRAEGWLKRIAHEVEQKLSPQVPAPTTVEPFIRRHQKVA